MGVALIFYYENTILVRSGSDGVRTLNLGLVSLEGFIRAENSPQLSQKSTYEPKLVTCDDSAD